MSARASNRLASILVATVAMALLALALAAITPGRAGAWEREKDEPRLVIPGPGMLRAGQVVEVRWAGGDTDGDELEIMLTLEGPRRRTIQVSPQLDPDRGVFVWRVPELGRAHGRFRVRFEHDGHEVEGTPSARIEILSGIAPPLDPALLPVSEGSGLPGGRAGEGRTARTGQSESDSETGLRARTRAASRSLSAPAERSVLGAADVPKSRNHSIPSFVPARN